MELGPLQTKWVEFLENNSALQYKGTLGRKSPKGQITGLCCLGAAELLICESKGEPADWSVSGYLNSIGMSGILAKFPEIGLRDSVGSIKGEPSIYANEPSLAGANDKGMPWKELAKWIRENPEKVFTKSV